ncbi:MAG TPA: XRE family transcriptional regulator [Methylotenera sp.]|jgi:predicted XRE-type DNA-binding protein|nr:XRE family transcriptional regulator [Methylotenera sp.]
MNQALFGMLFILFIFLIMTPIILWINNHFNVNPDEVEDLSEANLEKLEIKKNLINMLADWIQESGLDHAQIALKLDVSMYIVSNIVHQRFDKFTVDSLLGLVLKTGKSVKIIAKNKRELGEI